MIKKNPNAQRNMHQSKITRNNKRTNINPTHTESKKKLSQPETRQLLAQRGKPNLSNQRIPFSLLGTSSLAR